MLLRERRVSGKGTPAGWSGRGVLVSGEVNGKGMRMALPYVECSTRPGLRDSEAGVTVHDITGRPERLRVEWDFLHKEGDQYYLPIGIVARHPTERKLLIEFSHEADSGANRIWVAPEQLLASPVTRAPGEK
jgi:hypothetical protein